MTTFDGWDARLCGDAMALPNGQLSENELMHFRTKGSKNGVRRYQTESGEWTPLGLRERKKREGWGDKAERKAAKKAEKSARKAARIASVKERRAAAKEAYAKKKASKNLSNLSDAELQKRINRVKMEQEYKELTKSPVLKAGEKFITSYLDAKQRRYEREETKAKRDLENNKLKAEVIKAKETTKQAKEATRKMIEDRKAGLAAERQSKLINAKVGYRATTIWGGIAKRISQKLSAGVGDKAKAKRTAEGKVAADRILKEGQEAEVKRQASRLAAAQEEIEKKNRKAAKKAGKAVRSAERQYGLDHNLN